MEAHCLEMGGVHYSFYVGHNVRLLDCLCASLRSRGLIEEPQFVKWETSMLGCVEDEYHRLVKLRKRRDLLINLTRAC
jgi:hypothetical protein